MKHFGAVMFFLCLSSGAASAQAQIIAQVVDGGIWQTTIVLSNTTAAPAQANLTFFQDTANYATQPWNLSFLEVSSTASVPLAAGQTLLLHTPGTAPALTQGWGLINADPGVAAYAIFTERQPGFAPQVGTSPAATSATRILVPFDNTSGNVAAMAIVNASGAPETVNVNVRTTAGAVTQYTLPTIPAQGHAAFTFPQQFAGTAGVSGLAEFYTTSGTFSILALGFTGLSLTSAPVYNASGPPILSGGGSAPPIGLQGHSFTLVGSMIISGATLSIGMQGIPTGDQYFITFNDQNSFASGVSIVLAMNAPLNVSGNTASFQNQNPFILTSTYSDITNLLQAVNANITAATITVTFTSLTVGSPLTGTVDFTIAGASTPKGTTVQGNFSGTLTQVN